MFIAIHNHRSQAAAGQPARRLAGALVLSAASVALWFCASLSNAAAGDWPQWRGPDRDAHVSSDEKVPVSWTKDPKVIWKIAAGPSYSSPIIAAGKLIYLDDRDRKETVHLLDAATGGELWSAPLDEVFEDEWGPGPRSTPFIDGDRLYVQSARGEFRCLGLTDGRTRWAVNFEKDFGVKFLGSKANEGTATRRGNNGSGVIWQESVMV
jgi:outer membrane protein assembly factor BamB